MRVTIDGGGNILTHGDDLVGGGVIEFPVNEVAGFPSGWSVTGSAPNRVMLYEGHQVATEKQPDNAPDSAYGGGGSGLPPQWSDGGHGDVTATVDDTSLAPITVDVTDPASTDGLVFKVPDPATLAGNNYLFRAVDPAGHILFDMDAYGSFAIFGQWLGGNIGTFNLFNALGQLVMLAQTDGAIRLGQTGSGAGLSIDPAQPNLVTFLTGYPTLGAGIVTPPADGDLQPNQCAFWFDSTDGAAKLRIKAKSADGTVVTGSVDLA